MLVVLLPWWIDLVVAGVGLPADVEQRLAGNAAVLVFGVLLVAVTVVWPGGLSHALGGRVSSLARRFRPAPHVPPTLTER